MKKFDVIYYDVTRWHYKERVEASTKESAKNKIIKTREIEKITKVEPAEDYIMWSYQQCKNKDGSYRLEKTYYTGYMDLKCFGVAPCYSQKREDAKRFMMKYEAQKEIKRLGRKQSEYKFEKVKAI